MAKTDLSQCRLYAILDLNYVASADAISATRQLLDGGVDMLQLRAKNCPPAEIEQVARELHTYTQPRNVPLIINDHPQIARMIAAEGVHLGQGDMPVAAARAIIGESCVTGKSTHSIEQAVRAENEGADYIGFGPLFATPTKPDYAPIGLAGIREVHEKVSIPIFCIGGINLDNLQQVIDAGASRVVMVSALLRAYATADYARCATDMLA
ncbi:MAG: thiamine phosphate synthase [Chthoniobacterales bacterium]